MKYTFFKILLWIGYLGLPFSLLGNSFVVLSLGFPFLVMSGLCGLILFIRSQSINREYLFLGAMFAIVPVITSLFAFDVGASLIRSMSGLFGYLIFICLISLYQRRKFILNDCLYIITSSGVVLSLYYIVNFSLQSAQYGFSLVISERTVGGLASLPWGASNIISAVLLFSLIASLHLINVNKKINLIHVSALIILLGIFLTLSRTGIFLSLLLLAFYFFQKNFLRKLPALLFIIVIFSALMYSWSVIDPLSFESLLNDRVEVDGGNGRLDIWKEKLEFLAENISNPIGYYSSLYVFNGVSAHNFYITTLIEQSFLGLLSLCFLFYPFFRLKAFLNENRLILFGFFLCMINLFFEDANSNQQYIFIFWLYISIIYICIQNKNVTSKNIKTVPRMVY